VCSARVAEAKALEFAQDMVVAEGVIQFGPFAMEGEAKPDCREFEPRIGADPGMALSVWS